MDLRDPLTQVNLVIHLCMEYPQGDPIDPILHRSGFTIRQIDRSVSLPVGLVSSVQQVCAIQTSCSPDLILVDSREVVALMVECKASSFGPSTSQARQARTLLLLTGPRLGEYLGIDVRDSLATYVVQQQQVCLQGECLEGLAQELEGYGLETAKWTVWGLSQQEDGIYASFGKLGIPDDGQAIRVLETDDPDHYEPIRFIPVDPSVGSDDRVGLQIFSERLRNAFVQTVISQLGAKNATVSISVDMLCSKIILFVWDVWNPTSQKQIRKKVRNYVRSMLSELKKAGVASVTFERPNTFHFDVPNAEVSRAVRKLLLSAKNRRSGLVPDRQEKLPFGDDENMF